MKIKFKEFEYENNHGRVSVKGFLGPFYLKSDFTVFGGYKDMQFCEDEKEARKLIEKYHKEMIQSYIDNFVASVEN